jgi:hypothetical protein
MLLQIDESFRISLDSSHQNLQLEQLQEIKDKNTGESKFNWVIVGYHGNSLRSILLQYKNETLLDDQLETINDVIDKLNYIDKTIKELVKSVKLNLDVVSVD